MFKIVALMRASALQAASYRLNLVFSVLGLVATTIPIYFVTDALQPTMEGVIDAQASSYFAFVLVGIFVFGFLGLALRQVAAIISSGIGSGTLEAMLSTSTRLPTIFAGLVAYSYCWQLVRGLLLLVFGTILGASLLWGQMLFGGIILILIILSYLAIGIVGGAMVLAFRTTGPLTSVVLTVSGLLGGVYYPTEVIPSWLENISFVVPLTYGLRSMRQLILNGASLPEIMPDVAILAGIAFGLLSISSILFFAAFNYARRTGTLTHY
jgi:ABC-2 type transport system permease protein